MLIIDLFISGIYPNMPKLLVKKTSSLNPVQSKCNSLLNLRNDGIGSAISKVRRIAFFLQQLC